MGLAGVPRISSGAIERARIGGVLDGDCALVVLSAPAGMGKTVAMAQWATATSRRGLWLRVAEGSGTPTVFAGQLALALEDHGLLEPGNPLSSGPAAFQFLDEPWGLLRRGLGMAGPIALAVDESEYLDAETVAGLLGLLAEVPGLTLRTTTRVSNGFTEPSLALTLDARVLGSDALALTAAEAALVLRVDEASVVVRDLLDHGGAPGLARLLTLDESVSAGGVADRPLRAIESARIAEVVDSFLRLRRPSWDPRFARFIEMICLADAVDAPLAAALTGIDETPQLLDRAEKEGLGQWRDPSREGAVLFEPSPFVQRSLAASARRRLTAPELRAAQLTIARWELDTGRAFAALRRAAGHRDWDLVTDIVRRHWGELLPHGMEVVRVFSDTPITMLGRLPLVTTLLAIITNAQADQRLRAVEYFLLAAYGSRQRTATREPADRALLRAIESAAQRVSGRDGSAAARAGFEVLEQMSPADRKRLGRNEPTVYHQIGTSLLYGGDSARALVCFRRSVAVSDAGGYRAGLQGLALLAGTLALDGEIGEARTVADRAEARDWPELWISGYPGSFLQLAQSLIALETGDVETAVARLRLLDPHRETIEHWAPLLHVEVLVELRRHRPDIARERLHAVVRAQRARTAVSAFTTARLRHTSALAALAAGDLPEAERIIGRGSDVRTAVSRARIALAAADPERALQLLQAAPPASVPVRVRAEHLAISAAAVASLERDDLHTRNAITRLDAVLTQSGQLLALALVPAGALDALGTSAQRLELPDFAAAVQRARSWGMIASPRVVPRLTVRELAVAQQLARHEAIADMAASLTVSPNTVKSQLRGLYRKLGVRNRSEALRALAAWGILDPGVPGGIETPVLPETEER